MPSTVELGWWLRQAVWWRWAGLSASQGRPSSVGLTLGQEQGQRVTMEPLPALWMLRAQRSRERVSPLREPCAGERRERALVFRRTLRGAATFRRSEEFRKPGRDGRWFSRRRYGHSDR